MVIPAPGAPSAQPSVLLSVPPLLNQRADLLAFATFFWPQPGGEIASLVPADTRFRVRRPDGGVVDYPLNNPAVRRVNGGVQLVIKADTYGEWYVRVQGSSAIGGQPVSVASEARCFVASSPFMA